MCKRGILSLIFLVFVQNLLAGDISWERTVTVHNVEPSNKNEYMIEPIKIDINSADKSQLVKLDGIGPKKAEAIIEFRTAHGYFKTLNDLGKIKGFSKKVLARIIEKNKEVLVITQP